MIDHLNSCDEQPRSIVELARQEVKCGRLPRTHGTQEQLFEEARQAKDLK
jgi:hypothetical protein